MQRLRFIDPRCERTHKETR